MLIHNPDFILAKGTVINQIATGAASTPTVPAASPRPVAPPTQATNAPMADAFVGRETEKSLFDERYEATAMELSFNPAWRNETGYLNNIVTDTIVAKTIPLGEVARCVDPTGRRMLIVNTQLGLVCAFQRHAGSSQPIVFNAPVVFKRTGLIRTYNSNHLSDEDLIYLFGDKYGNQQNVGRAIAELIHELNK